jgi:hypothetical protein
MYLFLFYFGLYWRLMDEYCFLPVACVYLLCRGVGFRLVFLCGVLCFRCGFLFGCDPKCELRYYYVYVSDTSFFNCIQVFKVREILRDGHKTSACPVPAHPTEGYVEIGRVNLVSSSCSRYAPSTRSPSPLHRACIPIYHLLASHSPTSPKRYITPYKNCLY